MNTGFLKNYTTNLHEIVWRDGLRPKEGVDLDKQLSELRSLFSLTVRIIVFVGLISSMFEISSPTVGETWSTTPNLLTAHGQRKTGEKQTSDVHHTAHTPRFFFKIHEIILTMSKDVQHRNIEED
ncbi:Hypothetical protein SMAX5B_014651 [Scophthalmus maximus]|uniref:Uncharacterized protein n=1 Tax=Scophthalmus maximus TaxID=52904 RepID=A0A2U9C2Z1_SCOMX|nr:Hypothetical protein SMAX5B_014651 [Scophthalmus maximus]